LAASLKDNGGLREVPTLLEVTLKAMAMIMSKAKAKAKVERSEEGSGDERGTFSPLSVTSFSFLTLHTRYRPFLSGHPQLVLPPF